MKHDLFRQTSRLALALPHPGYLDYFLVWLNDPEVTQFLGTQEAMQRLKEQKYLDVAHERSETDQMFVLIAKTGTELVPIGAMGIHRIDRKHQTATTGAFIGDIKYQNQGLGADAKMLLLYYAFNTLNLRKICSTSFDFNERSRAYNAKCGYAYEGTFKRHRWSDGEYRDEVHMAVFREDWLPLWDRFVANGMTLRGLSKKGRSKKK